MKTINFIRNKTENMNIALVLSGGGGKGAFEIGVLNFIENVLKKQFNFTYNIIAGVSVGCLNGGMLAMNKYSDLLNMWNNINNSSVYSGTNIFSQIYNILKHRSIYSNAPLYSLIKKYFDINSFQTDFRFGLVSLIAGKYFSLSKTDFSNSIEFQKAILASATMPIVWEPIDTITLANGKQLGQCVDGGLRNVSPLSDVLSTNPTHIIIINCSPMAIAENSQAGNNILTIADRALADIAIQQIFDQNVLEFLRINKLVKEAADNNIVLHKSDGTPYKYFKSIIIQPDSDLGNSLDFTQPIIQSRMNIGYNIAKREFLKHSDFFK